MDDANADENQPRPIAWGSVAEWGFIVLILGFMLAVLAKSGGLGDLWGSALLLFCAAIVGFLVWIFIGLVRGVAILHRTKLPPRA